jgi:hypothetical protein
VRGTIKVIRLHESRQRASSRVGVPMKLGDEGIRIGKSHRIAQPCDECDVDAVTVKITPGIEHVRLERSALFAKGRTSTEIHHTVEPSARSNDLNGVYPIRRQ